MGKSSTPQSRLTGSILLASPSMGDAIFEHSVILLVDYSAKQGALGFILNRPFGKTVGQIAGSSSPIPRELYHVDVFVGGPVMTKNLTFAALTAHDGQLFYRMQISAEEALEHAQTPGTLIRAFIGSSGWSPGQLEKELELMAWIQIPCPPDLLSYIHDETLWNTILRGLSPYHALISTAPRLSFLN
ncbi:YqgE/AlgH family protein [Akkermansia sp. N21169]|jgi:putative transcriptional regulator|uniref:YqgE/AlgH family protein n=1 Tax=Akkermansia sp. N21169 TaxID=3040765 RepID=UPI00244EEB47|nr:YqgE/AlgH family protein [Akkermansia sp. N21169]MDH3069287.1 YqgE/AlgH family protein [Akkermansia sp. N21169]